MNWIYSWKKNYPRDDGRQEIPEPQISGGWEIFGRTSTVHLAFLMSAPGRWSLGEAGSKLNSPLTWLRTTLASQTLFVCNLLFSQKTWWSRLAVGMLKWVNATPHFIASHLQNGESPGRDAGQRGEGTTSGSWSDHLGELSWTFHFSFVWD